MQSSFVGATGALVALSLNCLSLEIPDHDPVSQTWPEMGWDDCVCHFFGCSFDS